MNNQTDFKNNDVPRTTKPKQLVELPEHEYQTLKDMGFLYEFFPEATGDYYMDCVIPRRTVENVPKTKEPMKGVYPAQDPNVTKVVDRVLCRAHEGMAKYGVTTSENPLSLVEWLRHLQEELMDASVYIERTIEELEK